MDFARRPAEGRRNLRLVFSAFFVTGGLFGPANAYAFDFFGLFGSEAPPAPSATTLPYEVEFVIQGDESVKSALQESSNFYKLRQDPPPDAKFLVQRLEADFAPMIDALWGEGYYNATHPRVDRRDQVQLGPGHGKWRRAASRLPIETAPSCR